MIDYIDPRDRRFKQNKDDGTTAKLRATVAETLIPPINPKAAEFWQAVLSDHVRNQHRKRIGAELITARWSHKAPVVALVTESEAAA